VQSANSTYGKLYVYTFMSITPHIIKHTKQLLRIILRTNIHV